MGSKGSSQPQYLPTIQNTSQTTSGTSSGVSTQQPDPLAKLAYEQTLRNASQIAQTPFEPYQGQMVAGFTPDQLAAFQGVRNMQGIQNPYIGQSGNLYEQSTNTWQNPFLPKVEGMYGQAISLADPTRFSTEALSRYMNPFQQSVIDATLGQMKQNQDVLVNQNTANAIRQGAFGGSGQFLGLAELGRQQALSNAQTLANLNAQNYAQAMGQYNQQQLQAIQAYQQAAQNLGQMGQAQQQLGVSALQNAAQGVAGLGKQAQQAALTDLQALMAAGQAQEAKQQQQLDAARNQWLQAKAYPYQQTSYFAGLAGGLGPLMGSTTQTQGTQTGTQAGTSVGIEPYQPPQQGGGVLPGLITGGLGLLGKAVSGGLLAKGGTVGERKNFAEGGEAEEESFVQAVSASPYASKGLETPVNSQVGLGALMAAEPYAAPDPYRAEAEKLQRVIKPASQAGRENLAANINKILNQIPEFREFNPRLGSGNMRKMSKYPGYGEGSESGGGWEDVIKSVGELAENKGVRSAVSKGLGALTEGFSYGGRAGYADGGTPQEQYQRSQQAQQQAQQVMADYQKYLGRAPDQPGFEAWTNAAAAGLPLEQISSYIQTAPERMRNVREAYVDYLGRAPEPEGYKFWTDAARRGMSFGDLQSGIRDSAEAQARRAAEPSKVSQGWAALDPSAGINRALARERMIDPSALPMSNYDMMLQQAMRRNPGPQLTPEQQGMPSMPGPDFYSRSRPTYEGLGQPVRGVPNLGLARTMNLPERAAPAAQPTAGSPFTAAPATEAASISEEQARPFIGALYKNYFGREPSQEEISEQVKNLQGGKSASELEAMFQSAPESQNTQYIRNLYETTLGRPADLGGLQFWKSELAKGTPVKDLASAFETSEEYKSVPAAFRGTGPVQGYYTNIGSREVNPYTGLFNLEYTAPYRGRQVTEFLPRKDGGRVDRARGGAMTKEDIARAALQAGATPKEAAILTAIAMPESGGNPYAHNPNWRTGDNSYGLWQINMLGKMGPERMRKFGLSSYNDLFDPVTNAKAALALLRSGGGLKNWTTFTSGKYMPYFATARNVVNNLVSNPEAIGEKIAMPEPPRRGLLTRLVNALSPVSSAQAADGSVLKRINPADPSGPLLPEASAERKPMFAMPKFAVPEMRNPRMATLPEALGRPNWPYEERGELPEFKKEVQTGFGPLQGEKPADSSQLLMEPTQRTNMGPEMPAEPVVAQDKPEAGAKSGQKYWGDWRDVEPFKSDPIGGFFDDLMGEKPRADKPGTLESAYYSPREKEEKEKPFDFGDLFPFAHGGVARNGYAVGGRPEDEEFDPLADIGSAIESGVSGLGDALGGLFGEGRDAGSAEEAAVAASDRGPRSRRMDPIFDALIASGLGMMAAPTANMGQAVGLGGLRGFQVYEAESERLRKEEEAAAQKAAAEAAAERYQRQISGEPMASDEAPAEKIAVPSLEAPAAEAEVPTTVPAPAEKIAAPSTGVTEPEIVDVEADPTLRRLSQQYARVASIPAPTGMASVKSAQLANLKFQIEERRKQLESGARARKERLEAERNTPEAQTERKLREEETAALSKQIIGDQQAANMADQRIRTLQRMREAVDSGKFYTGAMGETVLETKKKLLPFLPEGMVDEEAIGLAEQFQKDSLQSVTEALGGKLGAGVSDSDVRFLTRMQPGLGTTKKGNLLALDASIKIEQRKQEIAEFDRKFRQQYPGATYQQYNQALKDWAEENPMFPRENKSVRAEDKGNAPTRGSVQEGDTIVRNGATYVWNAERGKYIRKKD